MNALQTIGFKKACRFVWFAVWMRIIHLVLFPQTRVFLLRMLGATIGQDTIIHDVEFENCYHYGFSKIVIGKRCFIGSHATLDCRGGVTMEDQVTISDHAAIITHINVGYPDHPLQKTFPVREQKVTVKRGSYIGSHAIILPGVTIGKEAAVGAGAVVTKTIAPHTLVAGVPAKKLRSL